MRNIKEIASANMTFFYIINFITFPMFSIGVLLMIITQNNIYEKGANPFILSVIILLCGLFSTSLLILADIGVKI